MHIRQKMSKLRHRVEDKLEHWEEKSKDLIGGFLGMFGRDGRIVSDCVSGDTFLSASLTTFPSLCTEAQHSTSVA